MIGRFNHVAIAVPDLKAATTVYRNTLGAKVSDEVDQPEHGVTTVFIELPNTKIELLGVLGDTSPIAASSNVTPTAASTISATRCPTSGKRATGSWRKARGSRPRRAEDRCRPASRCCPHPKDFCGTLVELEEA